MQKTNAYARSFWFAPDSRKRIDKARITIDIVGLGIVYTFGSLFPVSLQWIISIYAILAWVTILTIDPSRLPDAATTKTNQKKAWRYLKISIPLLGFVIFMLLFFFHIPLKNHFNSPGPIMNLVVTACMMELYYRNVLQVKLRQFGLSVMSSILLQSLCFATSFYLSSHSLPISIGALLIGITNGWIVYKTRSISPLFIHAVLWMYLF